MRLRLLEERDLAMTLAWRNQDHIRKWFLNSGVIAADQHRDWFERYRHRDDDFVFVIEETEVLRRAVGQAAIYHVDPVAGRAEFGRLMIGDAEARGLGLARLATQLLIETAFQEWGLTELTLEVVADNEAAIGLYRSCGFTETSRANGVIQMRLGVSRG